MNTTSNGSSGLGIALIVLLVFYIVIVGVLVWAYVRIIRRAGYSGWWVLTGIVPLLNIIMLLMFAFKQWPIQREVAQLRAERGFGSAGYGRPNYGQPPYGQSPYGQPPYGR